MTPIHSFQRLLSCYRGRVSSYDMDHVSPKPGMYAMYYLALYEKSLLIHGLIQLITTELKVFLQNLNDLFLKREKP